MESVSHTEKNCAPILTELSRYLRSAEKQVLRSSEEETSWLVLLHNQHLVAHPGPVLQLVLSLSCEFESYVCIYGQGLLKRMLLLDSPRWLSCFFSLVQLRSHKCVSEGCVFGVAKTRCCSNLRVAPKFDFSSVSAMNPGWVYSCPRFKGTRLKSTPRYKDTPNP